MANNQRRLCLVSMPFSPVLMPSLGVSTLKATLAQQGIAADIYYGAFEFFNTFFESGADPKLALFDYNFIASSTDLGNTLFADALWDDTAAAAAFTALENVPHPLFDRDQVTQMTARFRGYVARVPELLERCLGARDWGQYDIVGFSSTFSQNIASLALARLLRARWPALHIVFGGANCEGEMGEQLMRSFPEVDALLRGEADFAFPEYVRIWRSGGDPSVVAGLIYRAGDDLRFGAAPAPVTDMDRIPLPMLEDYVEQRPELLRRRSVQGQFSFPIETSRGCWWGEVKHCIFCGLNPTMMTFRAKSPQRAIAEFRHLKDHYGASTVYAVDNIISRKYLKEVMPELRDLGLKIFYETKSNLKEHEVQEFALAGIDEIQPGIESLSSDTLELMKKGVKAYQNVELLKWSATYGVRLAWFLLYGFPGEKVESYLRTIAMIPRLVHLQAPKNPNLVTLDRYSPLYVEREKYGLKSVRPANRAHIYYRGLSEEARARIVYHFDMELPEHENIGVYRPDLWSACLEWSYQNHRGARLYQFESSRSTLIVDTRRQPKAYLLTGVGHRLHRALREARSVAQLIEDVSFEQSFLDFLDFKADDLQLAHVASQIGAAPIRSPESAIELDRFLTDLDEFWLTVTVDGVVLALAIDCLDKREAGRYGLADFVRVLKPTEPVVAAPRRVAALAGGV